MKKNGNPIRVLYVARQDDTVRALLPKLRDLGYHVDWTPDRSQALVLYNSKALYDVIVVEQWPQEVYNHFLLSIAREGSLVPLIILIEDDTSWQPADQLSIQRPVPRDQQLVLLPTTIQQVLHQHGFFLRQIDYCRGPKTKYRQIVENTCQGILVLQDRLIKFVNTRAAILLGYMREELLGRVFFDLLPPEESLHLQSFYQEYLAGRVGEAQCCTFNFIDSHGMRHCLENKAVLITWEGRPAILNFLTDISARKKLESELLKMQKMESIALLANGIAHDFNNLLSIILGNINIIQTYTNVAQAVVRQLEFAEQAILKARSLTQRLVTFATGGTLAKQKVPILPMLQEVTQQLLAGSSVQVHFSIEQDPGEIEIDPQQIRQVIANVIENARDAMPSGGKLHITIGCADLRHSELTLPVTPGQYLTISIRDYGCGIPSQHLSQVFDPYFSTKSRGAQKGMGLGLAIAYAVIKKHAGYIQLHSKLGQGTCVVIYLPISNGA